MSIQIVSWLKVNSSNTCLMCMTHSSSAVSYCKYPPDYDSDTGKKKPNTNIFFFLITRPIQTFLNILKVVASEVLTVSILTLPSCTVNFNAFLSPISMVPENRS